MHENDAFMAYLENYFHPSGDKEMLRKAGFYIGDPSFIGASPDGIIEREGNIYKIIEINVYLVSGTPQLKKFAPKTLSIEDDLLHLKKTHSYYYQIQGAMGAAECDFIVWTTDKALWEDVMLPKLCEFYCNR